MTLIPEKERKEYRKSVQATWTKEDAKRIRRLYPKLCLYCGEKTEMRTHITLSGRYKGNKNISYHCTNPRCGAEWGGYV